MAVRTTGGGYKMIQAGTRGTYNARSNELQRMEQEATLANLNQQQQIEAIYNEIIARYQPGGTFEQKALAQLSDQKARDVTREYGGGVQDMISRGLFGTTVMPTREEVSRRWERDVGAPARLTLEDIQMQRLSSAQLGKANFLNTITNRYPDAGAIAEYSRMAAAGGGPTESSGISGPSKPRVNTTEPSYISPWIAEQNARAASYKPGDKMDITMSPLGGYSTSEKYAALQDFYGYTPSGGQTTTTSSTTLPYGFGSQADYDKWVAEMKKKHPTWTAPS